MKKWTTVGGVVALVVAAALAFGHRAEARDDPPPVVGGLGGIYLYLDGNGDPVATSLAPTDNVPADAVASAVAVTTEDPNDTRDGGPMTVYTATAPAAPGQPPPLKVTIIPGSLYITFYADGSVDIGYSYIGSDGNPHSFIYRWQRNGGVYRMIDGKFETLRSPFDVE